MAAVCAIVALGALPASASAHSHSRNGHRITIHAQPNPDQTGDPVVIFGRLTGANAGNRTVTLWHRIRPAQRFTPIQRVRTDANGFYLISRAEGVVKTNRDWFVRSLGAQSRTVRERVQAIVSLQASSTTASTGDRVTFTGTVTPGRAGERVVLQRQVGSGDDWRRIGGTFTRTDGAGHFSITERFRVPDTYTVRARFLGDARDAAAPSDSVDVTIQQRQNPKLTLSASADPITVGDPVTLSGTVTGASAGTTVALYGREHGQGFRLLATTATAAGGGYSFGQVPAHTTLYRVRAGQAHSALLVEAVTDRVTATADDTTPTTGQVVTFTGTVAPDKTGHAIELQRLGIDGDWHDAQYTRVGTGSTYRIAHRVQSPGTKTFRVHIDGGPYNRGASSAAITLTVAPPPPSS